MMRPSFGIVVHQCRIVARSGELCVLDSEVAV